MIYSVVMDYLDMELYEFYELGLLRLISPSRINGFQMASLFRQACEENDIKTIKYLLKNKIDNYAVEYGFLKACDIGALDTVVFLVNIVDHDTIDNGLSRAVKYNKIKIVMILTEYGANVENGLLVACKYGKTEILEYFSTMGARNYTEGLRQASLFANENVIRYLIKTKKISTPF
jgi:ankyrin repeat protein